MRIAASACLLGHACRYDGTSKPCEAAIALAARHELVPICPEVAGGMPVPHPPCEIASFEPLRVIDCNDADRTEAFARGAERTLQKVRTAGCAAVILKAKSPSCGIGRVYDGTFTSTLVNGDGVAAHLLLEAGLPIHDEHHIPEDW